jgi:hypothetical protein
MQQVSQQLTDSEIQSLASYLQGLHPARNDIAVASAP